MQPKQPKAEREKLLIEAAENFNAVVRGPSTKAALRDAKARLMAAVSEVQPDEPNEEFSRMVVLTDAELLRQLHERIAAVYRVVTGDHHRPSPERMLERIESALAGIPNPEAVRELVAACREAFAPKTVANEVEAMLDIGWKLKIIRRALESLSAPSTGAQQK